MIRVPFRRLCCSALTISCFTTVATAQTALPTITVETPSPIVKRKPTSQTPPQANTAPAAEPGSEFTEGVQGPFIFVDGTFVPVTVVNEQEVLATGTPTLTGSLDQKPGISGSTFAPGANRPIIRGLDNNRVRVQENGIGSHDVSALSEDHAIAISPHAAKKVEVVRGPSTLRYGGQAIGGVVAVQNNRIPTFVPRRGIMGSITGGFSSVDDGKDGSFSVTAGGNGLVIHADGFRQRTSDYSTPRGTQFNTFSETDSAAFGVSRVWSNGYFGVAYTRFSTFYGVPGEGDEFEEKVPRIDMVQDKFLSRGEWRLRSNGIEAIRFWLGFTDYAHDEIIIDEGSGLDVVGTRFTNKQFETRLEVQHLPFASSFGLWSGALGVQVGQRKETGFTVAEDADGLLDPAKTNTVAAYIFEELKIRSSKLRMQIAARIEHTKVDGNGVIFNDADPDLSETFDGEQSFTPISASLGFLYNLPAGVVASLTGKYTERAPAASELYSKGIHEATETFEVGNPFLEKEKAFAIELGFRRAKGPFRFDATAFYTKFDGFIFKQLDPDRCGEDLASCGDPLEDELSLVLFQQRDATFYGTEISAQYDVSRIWNGVWGIYGQYDFVRAEFENGENVPRIPPHRLGGGLYYKDGKWYGRVGALHAFEQDKIGFEEIVTPGYTLVSAELSYTTKLDPGTGIGSSFTLGIKGENLADDDVRNHVSFKRRQNVLLPGRTVRVFGRLRWQ